MLIRDSHDEKFPIFVLDKNKEINKLTSEEFLKLFKYGVIRIWNDEYNQILKEDNLFGHFNLSPAFHKIYQKYILPRIVDRKVTEEFGDQPVLDFENAIIGECIEIEEEIEYQNLEPKHFEHSMSNIKNEDQLHKAMLKRYGGVNNLPDETISNLPVTWTLLKKIGTMDFNIDIE